MSLITPILLSGISASLLTGYYYLQQEKKLYKIFESLDKIPEFDFDYLGKIQDLPLNQPVALCAEIDEVNSPSRESLYDSKKKVVYSTVKKIPPISKNITKQSLNDENETFDEFYYSIPNTDLPKFCLKNDKQERIEVEWPNVQKIGFFNVKPIVEKIDPEKAQIPTEPLSKRLSSLFSSNKKAEYNEIGLKLDEKYVYIGELTAPSPANPTSLLFKPQYVLGESQYYFLKYLDGQLIKANKNGKGAFILAFALTSIHLSYKIYNQFEARMKTEQEVGQLEVQPNKNTSSPKTK